MQGHGWWNWQCFFFGHDLGGGPESVEWVHEHIGRIVGFYCRRGCGKFFGREQAPTWIGIGGPLITGALGALVGAAIDPAGYVFTALMAFLILGMLWREAL